MSGVAPGELRRECKRRNGKQYGALLFAALVAVGSEYRKKAAMHRRVKGKGAPSVERAELRSKLDAMWAEAKRGDGLSYDVFVSSFSSMVDSAFPEDFPLRATAVEEARAMGYASSEELVQEQKVMAEMGYCRHGLDPNCCPVGCGDLD